MKKLIIAAAILLSVLVCIGVYKGYSVLKELEADLRTERQLSATLSQELRDRKLALEHSKSETEAVRRQAELASRDAEENAAAVEAARGELQEAELGRSLATQAAQEALGRESRTRKELTDLRERRKQELDRMQQALSKIAPTRRTPAGMVIELANDSFYFDFDKAALRPENREVLSRIAGVLLASEGFRLFVYGHTDDVGATDYNRDLSLRRANSVADYLQRAGVPKDVMNVKGFGQSSPRVKNADAEGRQKNRRVEIGIVDSVLEYKGVSPGA
jgi:outer membrane protein OmpA-like peptidoglycan-associated protein